MRRGLAIIAGLVGFLVLAAWLVPPAQDASRYRATLEDIASEALGSRARIEGKVAFTLLPLPRLTAINVMLGNDGGAMLQAEELRLRVSPWRLLAGHFTAHDLVLRGVELHLPWPPRFSGANAVPAQWVTPFPTRVERARLILGGLDVRDITADIQATENGFELRGTARVHAQDWHLSARLSPPDSAGVTRFEANADGSARQPGASLRINGRITPQGEAAARASIHAGDLSQLLPVPAMTLGASGQLSLTANGLRAEDWTVSLPSGVVRMDGVLAWQPAASLALHLAAPRLDLDPWLPVMAGTRTASLPITLDVDVAAASLGGRDLRQLRGRLAWGAGGIALQGGSAILPGEAALSLDGTMPAQASASWFTGQAHMVADDPRESLAWMASGISLKPPAPFGLPPYGMDLKARVELGANAFSLADMQGRVAGTDVRGSFGLRQDGPRAMVLADLELGQVRLDSWPDDVGATLPVLGRALASLDGDVQARILALRLAGRVAENLTLDANLADGRLNVRRLAGNALGARFDASFGLAGDGRVTDGRLELNAANAVSLRPLAPPGWQATPALWEAPINLRADLSGTMDNLATRAQVELGDLRLDAQQAINATAGSGGFRLNAHHPGARRLLALLGILDPASPGSLGAWVPDWPGEGSFSLQAQGNWRGPSLALDAFQLTAGGLRGGGQLTVDATGEAPVVSGQFHSATLPVPWPPASADAPLPARPLQAARVDMRISADEISDGDRPLARQAVCGLALARAEVSLTSCTMQIAAGTARLDASLSDTAGTPRLKLNFSLDDARLGPTEDAPPFGVTDGTLAVQVSLSARGHSLAALRDTAEGEARVNLSNVAMTGIDLPGINAAFANASGRVTDTTVDMLRAALLNGTTSFDSLTASASLSHGVLRLREGSANGPAGALGLSGDINLGTGLLDATIAVRPTEAPEAGLEVRLSGDPAAPTRAAGLLRALRWLAERTN